MPSEIIEIWNIVKEIIKDIAIYPEVPSFYTKDYVGAGISISS